ncbi:hypothetical protein C8J57DRAFT_1462686 [Mycena rebaudengoi]|nr:hypothetical protein C8J57DRAFT_1462686 [Mycena rebaudengoi]
MPSLQNIPSELLEHVCHFLDAKSILRLTEVSRQFSPLLDRSSALQYKVHLEFAGLCDGPGRHSSSSERLEMLQTYQAAWADFDSAQKPITSVSTSGQCWELVGNVLATYNSEKGYNFIRIPSVARHIPLKEWTVPQEPVVINDFTMDLSQNLLVAVMVVDNDRSSTVRLLSLDTGRPHPLARNSCLSHQLRTAAFECMVEIRIFGEYVGVLFEPNAHLRKPELLIWEWKSGNVMKNLCVPNITSFAFLDTRCILVTTVSIQAATALPEIKVIEIDGVADNMNNCFSFRLPGCICYSGDASDFDLTIQTEPPASWPLGSVPDEPFTISSKNRLFVVSLQRLADLDDDQPAFMLCVLLSTLQAFMEARIRTPEERTLVWDEWGPRGTRMLRLPADLPSPWVCFVYGQRCIIQMSATEGRILDFNRHSVRQDELITEEKTVDKRRRLFFQPVTTAAPFSLLRVNLQEESAAMMLAEDGVVAVSMDEDMFTIYSV